jgi:tetratricopeptide (TPR) repeat protein
MAKGGCAKTKMREAGRTTGNLWPWIAVAALVVAVFSPSLGFDFTDMDDRGYVIENPFLRLGPGLQGFRWAVTAVGHAANWHPVTWLSLMLDYRLFGLDARGYHLVNLLIHLLNAGLFGSILERLTGRRAVAFAAAAVWAVHPLRVESVVWISERKDLLCAFFWLLSVAAYRRWLERPGTGRYLALLSAVALAMAAKPMAVTLPVALLLLDWWPLGRLQRGRWPVAEKVPLLLLSAATSLLTVMAQREAMAPFESLPPLPRMANAARAVVAYLGRTLLPIDLAPFYPYHPVTAAQLGGAILLLGAGTLLALRLRRSRPSLSVAWWGFALLLLPTLGLIQVGGQAMADRYTYLPHLLLIGGAACAVRLRPAGMAAATVLALACLAPAARAQVLRWGDDRTLFEHAISVTRGNWMMHYNLGNVLAGRGDRRGAEEHFRAAIAAFPGYVEARNNLGSLLAATGHDAEAEGQFRMALAVRPGHAPAWFNLGKVLEARGDYTGALGPYAEAARLVPDRAEAHLRLGAVLLAAGRTGEAGRACARALELDPGSAEAAQCLAAAGGAFR